MKLKHADCLMRFFPSVNSDLNLLESGIILKCEENLDIIRKSGYIVLVRWPGVGFAWVNKDDLID